MPDGCHTVNLSEILRINPAFPTPYPESLAAPTPAPPKHSTSKDQSPSPAAPPTISRRVLPDFVTVAGPLLAQWPDDGADLESLRAEARNRITEALASLPGGDDGLVLEACYAAEAFLSTWQDELPFGRPI